MQYLEYAVSDGPGTLIAHGVASEESPPLGIDMTTKSWIMESIDADRFDEFVFIHGGERAT